MTLSRYLLEQSIDRYESAEDGDDEERERLETLPVAFENGSWTPDDVEWIVRWKSARSTGYFERNSSEDVETHVGNALAATSVSRKLDSLTELQGVQVRVASAVLLFTDPARFTVLDWRAWDVLHRNGYLRYEMPSDPSVEDYLLYLGACWAVANEYDVSLRTLDAALWALGGEG